MTYSDMSPEPDRWPAPIWLPRRCRFRTFEEATAALRRTCARLLVRDLRAAGGWLRVEGGRLLFGPGRVVSEVAGRLAEYESEILEVLRAEK